MTVASGECFEKPIPELPACRRVLDESSIEGGEKLLSNLRCGDDLDLFFLGLLFFLVAALLVPGSRLAIHGVGLNPTRSALLGGVVGEPSVMKPAAKVRRDIELIEPPLVAGKVSVGE